ncbi:MAG TPA: hypothetical protein VIL49_09755, partial [Capillimicrobium sp.]
LALPAELDGAAWRSETLELALVRAPDGGAELVERRLASVATPASAAPAADPPGLGLGAAA